MSTVMLMTAVVPAAAQSAGVPDDVRQMLGADPTSILNRLSMGQSGGGGNVPSLQENGDLSPPVYMPVSSEQSQVERIFSSRAGTKLQQFGYDSFRGRMANTQSGSVQDNYVLGPGDQLQVSLRGQENATYTLNVDREGRLTLPRLRPIPAVGRTMADFTADLRAAVKQSFIATEAYVSLGTLRRVTVVVSGEVNSPGVKTLTAAASPLDALLQAFGVKKSGTLRNITLLRGGKRYAIDLYSVFAGSGGGMAMRLADGDNIIVPPLGRVVAVAGWARRPAIYELSPGRSAVSVSELLRLAGGVQIRGKYQFTALSTTQDGRRQLVSLGTDSRRAISDGDILFIQQAVDETVDHFDFYGPSTMAGRYSLQTYSTLSGLLNSPGALGRSPYPLFGMIVRKNRKTLATEMLAFSPTDVRMGRDPVAIQNDDIIRIFSASEARILANSVDTYLQRVSDLQTRLRLTEVTTPTTQAPPAGDASANGVSNANTNMLSDVLNGQSSDVMQQRLVGGDDRRYATLDMIKAEAAASVARGIGVFGAEIASTQSKNSSTTSSPMVTMTPEQQIMIAQNQLQAQTSGGMAGTSLVGGYLPSPQVQLMQSGLTPTTPRPPDVPGAPFSLDDQFSTQGNVTISEEVKNTGRLAAQLGLDNAVLLDFLSDQRISISGAVRRSGTYLVAGQTKLDELVSSAGGTTNWADKTGIELVRTDVDSSIGRAITGRQKINATGPMLASIDVRPRDQFHFSEIFNDVNQGTVSIQGEVRSPGTYNLVRGDKLSTLLERAGGTTDQAFPYGAVFLRKSVAQAEEIGYRQAAQQIQSQLIYASASASDTRLGADTAKFLQTMVEQIRNQRGLGRMTVVADPAVLAANPQSDVTLQEGDFLYIPPRPTSVTVVGEVLHPGTFLFKPDIGLDDYVNLSGGFTSEADGSFIFIINPDGTSRKYQSSLWNFDSKHLAPGAVIVVPRDLAPLNIRQLALQVTSILSNLAVTAASLAVIGRQ